MSLILQKLKHIVTQIAEKLQLFPEAKKSGRPLAIKREDALAYALYQHRSTRATKKSVYDDFKKKLRCTYKTFVVSINRAARAALPLLAALMRMNRSHAHPVKYTDSTDVPVCLNKNATRHCTMRHFASWGHSGKGFYYGLKMTLTRDDEGKLLGLKFTRGNANDRDIFRSINKDIGGILVADAGYVSKQLEKDMYVEGKRWCLIRPLKKMRKLAEAWQLALYEGRFKIEFDFRNLKLFHGLVTSLPRSVDGYLGNYLFALLSFVFA